MKSKFRLSYLLIFFLVFIMQVGILSTAGEAVEKTEDWVARYNSPGNGPDFANALTVDSLGNVIVTGRSYVSVSNSNYATIKYDPNGTQLWIKQYDGPANGVDFAKAIAVDSFGNFYVTGESYGGGTSSDYATLKYDPSGNQLWASRYDGPFSGWDSANAIAVDQLGNAYVTGWSENDYATVKYDIDGNQLWEARYDGPGSGGDVASAIAIDSYGNILVTGWSEGDYATIKYDPNGTELWVKRYDGTGNGTDEAADIAIDSLDNICVTGKSYGIGTNYDYATIKYDTNGTLLWAKRYNGTGNSLDEAIAIAFDSSDNVFVTGDSIGSGTNHDYATVKYDIDGNQLWAKRYNGPENSADEATDIAVDSSGNVFVTGQSIGSELNTDYETIKYDPNGNEVWFARYNGPGNDSDEATTIAIDSLGNAFVTGKSIGSGTNRDYATLKYTAEIEEETEITIEILSGWSIISIPVLPDDATLDNLFPEAIVVYKFDKSKGYIRVEKTENIEVGMGYWILLNTSMSYTFRGKAVPEYTIPITDGWFMIGACSSPAQKMIKNGNYIVVYGFVKETGYIRINDLEPLEPGKGYWILFRETSEGAEFTATTSF